MRVRKNWIYLGRGIAASAVVAGVFVANEAKAELIYGVSDQLNQLVSFDSASPGTLLSAHNISGLQGNEQLRGVDWINGTLYGLGDGSHLYIVNPNTAAATLVGAGAFSPALNGIDFGFNAGTSQLYVSSDLGQNLTINPVTGAATAGPDYTAGSSLDALAYDYVSGNFYAISAASHSLFSVNPATGAVTLVGPTGVAFQDRVGFDISPNTDTAYFSATVGGQTEFFTVNKATGALTLVGAVGDPGELSSGLDSIAVVNIPEPSALAFLTLGGLLFGVLRREK
jgi:DNA-binding beta-propeller fold protein YncE